MTGGESVSPETVPLWVSLIGNFGFPISITVYLFIRFEKKIDALEIVIIELSTVIKELKKTKMN